MNTKMKLAIIASIFLSAQAGVIAEDGCDGGVTIGDIYEIQVLKTDVDRPFLLAVDHSTDTLYFSYSVNVTSDDESSISARLDLNTKHFQNIEVTDGYAQAVDPKTHDVYIGGNDGIYKYDPTKDKAELYAEEGKSILNLFYKDVLYYSDFPSQFLYTVSNGEVTRFKDLKDTKIIHFLIDIDDDMFFSNDTGLYGQKKGTKDAVLYKKIKKDSLYLCGITMDINGKVYVCMQDGIYAVNKEETSLAKVVEIDDAFGVAFDKYNNMIYADASQLVRLKRSENKNCKK